MHQIDPLSSGGMNQLADSPLDVMRSLLFALFAKCASRQFKIHPRMRDKKTSKTRQLPFDSLQFLRRLFSSIGFIGELVPFA
jgi:hypothetical protein